MRVLGFSAFFHDSAAAIVEDGRVVAAAEEERFTREPHTKGFPSHAIRYCLSEAGIAPEELDVIAFFLDLGPTRLKGFGQALQNSLRWVRGNAPTARNALRWARGNPRTLLRLFAPFRESLAAAVRWSVIVRRELGLERRIGPVLVAVPHHLAHIGGSYLLSGFSDAAILIADGRGEWTTTTLAVGQDRELKILRTFSVPDSLGFFYGAITAFLGFRMLVDEGKVMGLSSYGQPRYDHAFEEFLRVTSDGLFTLNTGCVDYSLAWSARHFPDPLVRRLGPPRDPSEPLGERHADIARSLQLQLERALLSLCRYLEQSASSRRLCLSGGVALNSVANGRLAGESCWHEVFVPPAPGDAGTALGAAVWAAAQSDRGVRITFPGPYLGPSFGDAEVRSALDGAGLPYVHHANVAGAAARLLSQGHVLGWFQGRMEFGPRALGNRSILADPRSAQVRDRVNTLKGRELWRPLAPSVLAEKAQEWFIEPVESPYMSFVKTVRREKADRIAACVHVDGTARVQTVQPGANPRYWHLLQNLERLTGVPCVLNTSFNRQGESIVCSPRDAVRNFLAMNLDYLVIGDYVAAREEHALPSIG
ncbi:MAG: carbamoyltransferase [Armatimonadetes bacterium]|nr:carbamoyltransferase [Armatimonadota bacterium]